MFAYLFSFLGATVSFAISTWFTDHKKKILSGIFELVTVILLAWIAGARSDSVGTDVTFYMHPSFQFASLYPTFSTYWMHYHFEFLYAWLSYNVEHLTGSFQLWLSILMAITVFFSCRAIKSTASGYQAIFAFVLFWLLGFNTALNYSRQMVAVSIVLFAQTYLSKRMDLRYFGFILLAFLFHRSALLAILFYLAYKLYHLKSSTRFTINVLVMFGTTMLLLFYNKILGTLIASGILASKYTVHLTSGLNISATDLALHLILMAMVYFLSKYQDVDVLTKSYYLEINVLNFAFLGVSLLSDTASRISLYTLFILAIIAIPTLTKLIPSVPRFQWRVVLILTCIAYWTVTVCIQDVGQTYPYHSDIIQFLNLF